MSNWRCCSLEATPSKTTFCRPFGTPDSKGIDGQNCSRLWIFLQNRNSLLNLNQHVGFAFPDLSNRPIGHCSILLRLHDCANAMMIFTNTSNVWGGIPMAEIPAAPDSPVVQLRATPLMTWNGEFARVLGNQKHYLHLSVFPCVKCHGPVIAGSVGTRETSSAKRRALPGWGPSVSRVV
jgi:hypothetical protein